MSIEGQVAWVTGGGSGIGLSAAIELAKAGCRVVVSGRQVDKLEAAVAGAATRGVPAGHIAALALDVGDPAAVERAARTIEAECGSVDVLVNSAGVNVPKRHWKEVEPAAFASVVTINLTGAAYCTLAVRAGMQRRGRGTVVNVASFAGWHLSDLTGPAYVASKAGLIAMTHSFNIEEGVNGLRATALCPGEVATPILDSRPIPPSAAEKARMLQEDDLGRTIRFIAEMPPHVCINELVISPVWNRIYIGGDDLKRR